MIFELSMFIGIELDGIWRLDMLLARKMMLCDFCRNQWIVENAISDQNRLFCLIMQVSEFTGVFLSDYVKKSIEKWVRLIMK